MKTSEIEIRNVSDNIMSSPEGRTVEGYAVVFNSKSEDIGFVETIHEGAITEETLKNSDIYAKLNHDDNKVLARSNKGTGSLKLELDEIGLRYSFEAPNTVWGDELLEHLKRKEINSSSFAFSIDKSDKGCERWTRDSDGLLHRDIYKINRLYDVSPVYSPAYSETSCSKRFQEVETQSNKITAECNVLLQELENL